MENKIVERRLKASFNIDNQYVKGSIKGAIRYIEQLEKENAELKDIKSQITVSEDHLVDWYINSVGQSDPIWTQAHINELLFDFDVFFKVDKNKEIKCPLVFQCSELNTMNYKLLNENTELKQQLKAKDSALEKACRKIEYKTQENNDCPNVAYGFVPKCCGEDFCDGSNKECWKEWCENGIG